MVFDHLTDDEFNSGDAASSDDAMASDDTMDDTGDGDDMSAGVTDDTEEGEAEAPEVPFNEEETL